MQQIDHRVIKLLIGVIAVSLAMFMQLVSGEVLRSISESWHYPRSRDWFVGLLFSVSVLFLSFRGENRPGQRVNERALTVLASLCAALVAVAPCACDRPPGPLAAWHFPAAVCLFLILTYFCWRFRKTAMAKVSRYPEARRRGWVYSVCLAGMGVCLSMGAVYVLARKSIDAMWPAYVFWLEAIGLVSFGLSWLAASRTVPLITNPQERYRLGEGRALEDAELR